LDRSKATEKVATLVASTGSYWVVNWDERKAVYLEELTVVYLAGEKAFLMVV
jgi:hypothetical protein